ncbi:hypothetical protein AB9R12_00040 [Neisseria gonorrhoeae]
MCAGFRWRLFYQPGRKPINLRVSLSAGMGIPAQETTMPNWCSNSLHFQGNPQRIAEVAEQILIKTDKGYQFSFQHIVPMPEELILPEVPDSYMQQTWFQIAQQPEKKLINLEREMLEQRDKSFWSVQYRLPDELFSELKLYFSEKFDWDNLTVGEVFLHFEANSEVASRFRYDGPFAKRIAENIRHTVIRIGMTGG